jgi:hypothetical protein
MSDIVVTERMVLGNVAKMATQQSPYPRPENLEIVLDKLHAQIKDDFKDYIVKFDTEKRLRNYLQNNLQQIPEYLAWNERKNGIDAPMKFVSRYDTDDNPDDDFIDLDALEQNICNEILKEN